MEVVEKKEIVHEMDQYPHEGCYWHKGYKDYASKGVAGAGLGLGIAGTALGLLAMSGRGLFGFGERRHDDGLSFQAWNQALRAELVDQKALYDYALLDASARFNDREKVTSEMFGIYKSQIDADFGLYKNQRDQFDVLANRIGKLETAVAVDAAVEPWKNKVLQMQIGNVVGMVNLEAERRCCADNAIVTYLNTTFYPKMTADVTTGTTTTAAEVYNPLPNCGCCGNKVNF